MKIDIYEKECECQYLFILDSVQAVLYSVSWFLGLILIKSTLSLCNRCHCLRIFVFPKELAKLNGLSLLLEGSSGH